MQTQPSLRIFESVVHAANWLIARFRPAVTAQHLLTGEHGEEVAFFYLRRMGYVVVARRYRSALCPGDIDLIAWEGDTLCFIEVKTRTSRQFATAESSVNQHKRSTLRRLARVYLRPIAPEPLTRFDILSVYLSQKKSFDENAPEIELFRGAFLWYEDSLARR